MVTVQAKQQPQQQQQQQQHLPRRQNSHECEIDVDEDYWNHQRDNHSDNTAIAEYNSIEKNNDDWTIGNLKIEELNVNEKCNRSKENVEENSSELVRRDKINGNVVSNGDSTQCSDLDEDDDEGQRELDLVEDDDEEEEDDMEDDVDDDDDDDDEGNASGSDRSNRWIRSKVVTTRVQQQDTSFDVNNGQPAAVLPNLDETTFGEVSITNSKHVHVGNTNFYKGPVTIKQFVYTNSYPIHDKDNGGFPNNIDGNSSGRTSDINPNDVPIVKGDPNGPILPSYHDYDRVTKWLWTWRCAAIMCVLALSLVTVAAVVSVLVSRTPTEPTKVTLPETPTSGANPDDELIDGVRFIERVNWSAQPASADPEPLEVSPTPFVIISHTASEPCYVQSQCVLRVRLAQTLHIESFGWDDIGYSFLVGGDGLAYVGRGWDAKGAHSFGYNGKSIGISFIGTFNDVEPNAKQLHAAKKVIEFGVKLNKIAKDYKLLGHRQISETLSPGDKLYNILTTWEHWSPTPRPSVPYSRATMINFPHPAAIIPLFLLILPYLILLIERFSKFFFVVINEFDTNRCLPSFTIYDKNKIK